MDKLNLSGIHRLLSFPLGKRVDQQSIEKWSATFWELHKHKYEPKATGDSSSFVMMFPPPNITGNLHLGHALTATIQDALIRQKRMLGNQVIWIPGFDHAGLATQSIVENLLWAQKNLTRLQLGREEFVKLAHEWKGLKRTEMRTQLNRLGLALDYDREYFTMDNNSSLAVHTAFKKLFKDGVIYRDVKPVFWSNSLETTLSDIEVERIDGVDRYIRTGEVVERQPVSQWFVNTKEIAHKSVEVVENGSIEMIPSNYKKSWSSWLVENGVRDWCISRQSWWGHRIPAFKLESAADTQENWVVADDIDEANRLLGAKNKIVQDPDVLDTWFSSSLLPLTVSGWPCEEKFTESLKSGLFPLDIMETGFDILTYWVSKMVMMSLALESKVPFKLVLLHGMICDNNGKKMSKSKGNVIDPLDVIDGASLSELQERTKESCAQGIIEEEQLPSVLGIQKKLFPNGIPACGADGLRGYLLSHDIQEEVVRVQTSQIDKIRRLSNKIWNIFRFAVTLIDSAQNLNLKLDQEAKEFDQDKLSKLDQQVLDELSNCIKVAHKSFDKPYQLHLCFNTLEYFWTIHLSSNYIENTKSILLDKLNDERELKIQVLVLCLVTSVKLLHPFMPHLTEFLYQKLAASFQIPQEEVPSEKKVLRPLGSEPFPSLAGL